MRTPPLRKALTSAIDRLYDEFAANPRPHSLDYCPCCFTSDEERAVLAPVPLRQVPIDVMRPYAADVMLTVGDVADLRYFLPRIVEIATMETFNYPELEGLIGRLPRAGWTSWPQGEQGAVRAYFQAMWTDALFADEPVVDYDAALCAIGNAEDDLTAYLAPWTDNLDRPDLIMALRGFVEYGCRVDRRGRLRPSNAYWGHRDRPVVDWLNGSELRASVEARLAADLDGDTAETREALEWLTFTLPISGGWTEPAAESAESG
ncbi:hypothetical protein HDA40_000174 [Hamadaea flava]|uniref:Uncharacterized protein n=1 Tax=Hamadaea flava TaxID=1742688 RepID=A0ABV8LZ69_9ACTN|nr:hypothetical protein [Hamadaea flava]MCP2321667.1 hypothetical protein [Hamadaea flava]